MKIAVITGASSGMGKEFVYAIDKEFNLDEIWVIARREEKLKELYQQGNKIAGSNELKILKEADDLN